MGSKKFRLRTLGFCTFVFSDSVYHWEGEIEVYPNFRRQRNRNGGNHNLYQGSLPELVYTNYRFGKNSRNSTCWRSAFQEYTQPAFNFNYAAKDARYTSAFQSNSQYRRVNQVLLTDEEVPGKHSVRACRLRGRRNGRCHDRILRCGGIPDKT